MTLRSSTIQRELSRFALVGLLGAAVGAGVAHSATGVADTLTIQVVDGDGAPVAGAVVTLETSSGTGSEEAATAVIDQMDLQFSPYVSAIHVGDQVRFVNNDRFGHHVYSFSRTKRFEVTIDTGGEGGPVLFDRPGVAAIGCNIHDNMLAYIYVVDDRSFAVTNDDGLAFLTGVEAGERELTVRHPNSARRNGVQKTIDTAASGKIEVALDVREEGARKGRSDRIEY